MNIAVEMHAMAVDGASTEGRLVEIPASNRNHRMPGFTELSVSGGKISAAPLYPSVAMAGAFVETGRGDPPATINSVPVVR
jgi:hypothetical protein